MNSRSVRLAGIAAVLVACALAVGSWLVPSRVPAPTRTRVSRAPEQVTRPALGHGHVPRVIIFGGGSSPEYNQLSLEQDATLATQVLGPDAAVYFAGGTGSMGIQVLDAEPRGDALLGELGEIFDPRSGREASYRAVELRADAASTAENVRAALRRMVTSGPESLFVFVTAHGIAGETPKEDQLSLWADTALDATELANELDRAGTRRVRLVIDSCFSGGFAELAFDRADEARDGAIPDRCGFFASTWDHEASGCDPNPDRGAHESYAMHFLNALRARSKDGSPLALTALDLDGDGHVSLLEAHSRARIVSQSIDVPTTTSERWLRHAAPDEGEVAPVSLPEEDAVIAALSHSLGLDGHVEDARTLLERTETDLSKANDALADAQDVEDDAARRVGAELLARWPSVDDPWHPDFASTFARDRERISDLLIHSESYAAYQHAKDEVDDRSLEAEAFELRAAPLARLVRALDTKLLAGRLRALGGPQWSRYARFLECERSLP